MYGRRHTPLPQQFQTRLRRRQENGGADTIKDVPHPIVPLQYPTSYLAVHLFGHVWVGPGAGEHAPNNVCGAHTLSTFDLDEQHSSTTPTNKQGAQQTSREPAACCGAPSTWNQ